jgi:hypothetical protein
MIAFILTGLAGVAIGVVIMRLLNVGTVAPSADLPEFSGDVQPTAAAGQNDHSAASSQSGGLLGRFNRTQWMLGGAGGLLAIAAALIAFRSAGSDASASVATPLTPVAVQAAALDDVDTMISKLAERLKTDTTDGEGFRMLGWS